MLWSRLCLSVGLGFIALSGGCRQDAGPKAAGELGFTQEMGSIPLGSVIEPPSGSPLLMGKGYNTLKAEVLGNCVVPDPIETLGGRAQKVTFQMKQIESLEDLKESLHISAEASYGVGIFKASAKASYLNSYKFSSHASYLLISVRVENQTQVLKQYHLTDAARELLLENPWDFLDSCGDEFIAAKTTGGEFVGLIQFSSNSKESKEEIDAQLRLAGGLWSAGADFKKATDSLNRLKTSNVSIMRIGGDGPLPDMDHLLEEALRFPKSISVEDGWPFSVTTVPYRAIVDAKLPKPISLERAQRFYDDLLQKKLPILKLRNDVVYVLEHESQFLDVQKESLQNSLSQLEDLLNQLNAAPYNCMDLGQKLESCEAPLIKIPKIDLPKRLTNEDRQTFCENLRREALDKNLVSRRLYEAMVEEKQIPLFKGEKFVGMIDCEALNQ